MGFDTNLEQIAKLRTLGIVDEKTKIIVNHFTHNGLANYDDMVELVKPHGIQVAYDGLIVTF
jgi:phosphoribosyl 1,2-cyclic phosphate phosphodiesterase